MIVKNVKKEETQAEREPKSRLLLIIGIGIGAIAGLLGGFAREIFPYGEFSIGLSDVFFLCVPLYFVLAGIISAVLVYFLLEFIEEDGLVPIAVKLPLFAIVGFIPGFIIVSGNSMPP